MVKYRGLPTVFLDLNLSHFVVSAWSVVQFEFTSASWTKHQIDAGFSPFKGMESVPFCVGILRFETLVSMKDSCRHAPHTGTVINIMHWTHADGPDRINAAPVNTAGIQLCRWMSASPAGDKHCCNFQCEKLRRLYLGRLHKTFVVVLSILSCVAFRRPW